MFGVSKGGISAFRIASLHPDLFHSLTVLPGWPKSADEKRLHKILGIAVNFLVGEKDSRWRKKSEYFSAHLTNLGGDVVLEIFPEAGHTAFQTFPLPHLMDLMIRHK
ncbi:MAG: hypothetical protein N2D54_02770 [Chloroflexota bacterium]